MKIQTKMKGRGMRAILCGLLSTLCIATCSMNVYAGYTSDNHPKTQLSPDGSAWTLIEELPYYDDYDTYSADRKHWNGKMYSFWLPMGKEISTGMPLNLPNPEVGQHEYNYNRTGNVPVYKWVVEWEKSKCIHRYIGSFAC